MNPCHVSELAWDSTFFGRKIGELHIDHARPDIIEESLSIARKDKYCYLLCKVYPHDICLTKILETKGFYLTDVAVRWFIEKLDWIETDSAQYGSQANIRRAMQKDIPMARDIVTSLFLHSRFYNDPFFKKEEADSLYQTWIENSITGSVADSVFLIDNAGIVTCRKLEGDAGEIVLVGVREEMQRQKLGRELMTAALHWFKSEGISKVSVKTQLRNVSAMNFYSRLGFSIDQYSLVFGNIL